MARVKSKKYPGVYYSDLKNGDRSYFIIYRDNNQKQVLMNVGLKSGGISEQFASNTRLKILNELKFGENPNIKQLNKRKIKNVISFDMMAERYFEDRKGKIKDASLKELKSKHKNHISPYIGNIDIDNIKQEDIEYIVNEKKEDEASDKKGLAPKTINMVVELISSIYNFGIKKKIFKGEHPSKDVELFKLDNARDRYLELSEITTLLDKVKDDSMLYIFCLLSLSTGARVSTVINITKGDIDFTKKTIRLYDYKNKTQYMGFIKENYFEYFNTQFNKNSIENSQLLVDVSGDKMEYRIKNIQRALKPVLDKLFNTHLGERDTKNRVVIHTLRHTFASQLAIHNTPIFTIQKLLNHKDIKQTLRYAKLAEDSGIEFLNSLKF
jgi:integrase